MPPVYDAPHRRDVPSYATVFQVFVGPGTAFDPAGPIRLPPTDFPGGPRDLLLIVEAAQPVPWTKPEDLIYAADRPLPPLGSVLKYVVPPRWFVPTPLRGMMAVDAGGVLHSVNLDAIDEETLRRSIALDDEGG